MFRLIIDDHIPFIKGVLEPFAEVTYIPGGIISRDMAERADGLIIRTRTRCDSQLLEGTAVKFIATSTIGYDHIDTEYCDRKNIAWHHAPGCNSASVQQYVASCLANLSLKYGFELKGKRIGIVGAGHVGSKIQKLANTLGMIPVVNDPPRKYREEDFQSSDIEEILATCDIVTLHVPLTKEGPFGTWHYADDKFMENIAKNPILVNTSRGDVVDNEAVKRALRAGKLSGYVADVWADEPVADFELISLASIATPHIAGYSVEGKAGGTAASVRAASRFFGFGIDEWYPPALPDPQSPEILMDASGLSTESILKKAIIAAYDVMEDDKSFRSNAGNFEKLRNFYPVRREFPAFTLKLKSAGNEAVTKLSSLGFSVQEIV